MTPAQLRELLHYDPVAGVLTWRARISAQPQWNARYAGQPALIAVDADGYHCGWILKKRYRAHRVAWAIHYGEWPSDDLDHEDGDRKNYKLHNLRLAHDGLNSRNCQRSKRNKSGVTGVRWYPQVGKWHAQICCGRRNIHLGLFTDKDEAIRARLSAQVDQGYHPNHGRDPRVHYDRRRS